MLKSFKTQAILPFLLLSACAGEPKIVRVPVSQPCVNAADIPPEVPPAGVLPEDARSAADVLGAVLSEMRRTDKLLRAILTGCQNSEQSNQNQGQ